MKINLTNREISMLATVVMEYVEMLSDTDSENYTKYMLENGLGSAMKKILKNKNGYEVYKKYASHRESFNYPTYEEWKKKNNIVEEEEEEKQWEIMM